MILAYAAGVATGILVTFWLIGRSMSDDESISESHHAAS